MISVFEVTKYVRPSKYTSVGSMNTWNGYDKHILLKTYLVLLLKMGLFSEFLTHSEVLLSSHCQMFFVILLFFKTKYLCSSNNQITMCCVWISPLPKTKILFRNFKMLNFFVQFFYFEFWRVNQVYSTERC